MESRNGVSTLKIAGTYIGTVVGAGFASGQEVLQFFVVFGKAGILGLIAVTLFFILFGIIIMDLGRQLQSTSHLSIIRHTGGRFFSVLADLIITFFLFGSLSAMIAGSGALFFQQFDVNPLIGNILMAILTIITVLAGFKGIVNSISFVVPFLLIAAIGISLASFFVMPDKTEVISINSNTVLMRNWLWSAILYTSYNTVISIAILGPLGAQAKNRKALINGAILGGLGLGVGAAAIFFTLKNHLADIAGYDVPMIAIAKQLSPIVQVIYAIVLLAEIYTSAVGNLYGFTARILPPGKIKSRNVIICTFFALIGSLCGFSNLVKYLYPLVGYGGVIILAGLLYNRFKAK